MSGKDAKSSGAEPIDMLAPGVPMDGFFPYLINRIANRLNLNLLGDLRPMKINVARWRVLAVLNARESRSIGELAAYTVMDQSTLSRVVDQMVRDGLVERRQRAADNRVVHVHILEAGSRVFQEILPKAMVHMEHALVGLDDDERHALTKLLHRVLDNIRTTPYG